MVMPAAIPVKFAPLIAGRVPVRFAAGKFVKLVADIAGNVPVKFAAGKAVRFAPEPCKLLKVPTPAVTLTPEASTVKPAPTTPFVPDNVNAILVSDYSYIYTIVSSLPDGIVIVLPDATAIGPATMAFLPALIE